MRLRRISRFCAGFGTSEYCKFFVSVASGRLGERPLRVSPGRTQNERTSPLHPIRADVERRFCIGCSGPFPDLMRCSKNLLFDHLVGTQQGLGRHVEAEGLCGLEVEGEFEQRSVPARCLSPQTRFPKSQTCRPRSRALSQSEGRLGRRQGFRDAIDPGIACAAFFKRRRPWRVTKSCA